MRRGGSDSRQTPRTKAPTRSGERPSLSEGAGKDKDRDEKGNGNSPAVKKFQLKAKKMGSRVYSHDGKRSDRGR